MVAVTFSFCSQLLGLRGRHLTPPFRFPSAVAASCHKGIQFPIISSLAPSTKRSAVSHSSSEETVEKDEAFKFAEAAKVGNLVPLRRCIFSDQLTPVVAYRCLVKEDDFEAPSFLFESVEQGSRGNNVGRYSVVGAHPAMEIVARENMVSVMDHEEERMTEEIVDDPMRIPKSIMEGWSPQTIDEFPDAFCDAFFRRFFQGQKFNLDQRLVHSLYLGSLWY